MTVFLGTFVFLVALEVIGQLMWLVKGVPPRTPESVAMSAVFNVGLLVWAVWLLSKQ